MLEDIESSHRSLTTLRFEGWLGEGTMDDIAAAGSALRARLLDDFGDLDDRPVHFHFFAFREGAAVTFCALNEATDTGTWPRNWRVRSVVLASPRAWGTLHHPRGYVLHPRCAVVTVTNPNRVPTLEGATAGMEGLLHRMDGQPVRDVAASIQALDLDRDALMNALRAGDARTVATEIAGWLDGLSALLRAASALTDELQDPAEGNVGSHVESKVQPSERPILDSDLGEELRSLLSTLESSSTASRDALQAAGSSMSDLGAALTAPEFLEVVWALDVHPGTLRGRLWDTLAAVISRQAFWHDALIEDAAACFSTTLPAESVVRVDACEPNSDPRAAKLGQAFGALPRTPFAPDGVSRAAALLFAMMAQCPGVPTFVSRFADWEVPDDVATLDPNVTGSLSAFMDTVGTLARVLATRVSADEEYPDDADPLTGGVRHHVFVAPAVALTNFPDQAVTAFRAQLGPLQPQD
ncbi:MAG: hypothetical protein R3B40_29375 [Polyangiales bacterium]